MNQCWGESNMTFQWSIIPGLEESMEEKPRTVYQGLISNSWGVTMGMSIVYSRGLKS